MEFVKRLTAPDRSNDNFYSTKNRYYTKDEHLVGQCTWYACGRFVELTGECKVQNANAKNWYGQNVGYEKGSTPKLGAILCFDGNYGHVAIVEEIHDGYIVTSEYNNGGDKKFYTRKRYANKNYELSSSTKFQGFIYPPVEFELEEEKSIDVLAGEVIAGKYGNGQDRKNALGDKYEAVQNRVNEILEAKTVSNDTNIDDIARAVIRGEYGNGQERKDRLTAQGYDYNTIQNRVNELLK